MQTIRKNLGSFDPSITMTHAADIKFLEISKFVISISTSGSAEEFRVKVFFYGSIIQLYIWRFFFEESRNALDI